MKCTWRRPAKRLWQLTREFVFRFQSFTRRVEAAGLDVCFDLTIPSIGHQALEPFREAVQLLSRES
jgi:hypothetical protein